MQRVPIHRKSHFCNGWKYQMRKPAFYKWLYLLESCTPCIEEKKRGNFSNRPITNVSNSNMILDLLSKKSQLLLHWIVDFIWWVVESVLISFDAIHLCQQCITCFPNMHREYSFIALRFKYKSEIGVSWYCYSATHVF